MMYYKHNQEGQWRKSVVENRLFHFKCQKGFVAPIVFFTVGNVSKWLFE